jgi:GntR family transcriptional regulator
VHLRIDPNAGEPLALQIARQVRLSVAAGRLAPGERLPGSRELAASLGVNFHTVRRAYADLEGEGLLRTVHGLGTFVAEGARRMSRGWTRTRGGRNQCCWRSGGARWEPGR